MKIIIFLLCTLAAIKILAFYLTVKVREQPRKNLYAEDIISPGYIYDPEIYKKKPPKMKKRSYSIPVGLLYGYFTTQSKKILQEEKKLREKEKEEKIQQQIDLLYEIGQSKLKIKFKERDPGISEYADKVSKLFATSMKDKKLSRKHILAIRNYLYNNVREYEKKRFNNDAHAIYCMLKADDLQMMQLEELEMFLKSIIG